MCFDSSKSAVRFEAQAAQRPEARAIGDNPIRVEPTTGLAVQHLFRAARADALSMAKLPRHLRRDQPFFYGLQPSGPDGQRPAIRMGGSLASYSHA